MNLGFPILFEDQVKYIERLNYIKICDGIPYIDWEKRFKRTSSEYGLVFYPITALIYRLGNSNHVINEKLFLDLCFPQKHGLCSINFDFPTYNLKSMWSSALAQALLILFLVRKLELGETLIASQEVDNLLLKCTNILLDDISKFGLFDSEHNWFHEYPSTNQVSQSFVLNGHLIVLATLVYLTKSNDKFQYENISKIEGVLDEVWVDTQSKLKNYDWGYWSKYCLYKNNVVNPDYHNLHIRLLNFICVNSNYDNTEALQIKSNWEKGKHLYRTDRGFMLKVKSKFYFTGLVNRLKQIS